MSKFKLWLENQEQLEEKIRRIFQQARHALLGSVPDNLSLSLSQLKSASSNSIGANQYDTKGAAVAQKVLGQVFGQLKSLGVQEITSNVDNAIEWLQNITSGKIKSNADHNVGHLLQMIFGKEFFEKFTGEKIPSEVKPEIPEQQPVNQEILPNDGRGNEIPPMSQMTQQGAM